MSALRRIGVVLLGSRLRVGIVAVLISLMTVAAARDAHAINGFIPEQYFYVLI